MKITIKNLQGKPTEYELPEDTTLENLKKKVATEFSCELAHIKLIHYGKVLGENERKLMDYGIKNGDFLVMMISKASVFEGLHTYKFAKNNRNHLRKKNQLLRSQL